MRIRAVPGMAVVAIVGAVVPAVVVAQRANDTRRVTDVDYLQYPGVTVRVSANSDGQIEVFAFTKSSMGIGKLWSSGVGVWLDSLTRWIEKAPAASRDTSAREWEQGPSLGGVRILRRARGGDVEYAMIVGAGQVSGLHVTLTSRDLSDFLTTMGRAAEEAHALATGSRRPRR